LWNEKNIHQLSPQEVADRLARWPGDSVRVKLLKSLKLANDSQVTSATDQTTEYSGLVEIFSYPASFKVTEQKIDQKERTENFVLNAGHAGAERIVVSIRLFNDSLEEFPAIKMRRLFPDQYRVADFMLAGEKALMFTAQQEVAQVLFIKHDQLLVTVAVSSLENNSAKRVAEIFAVVTGKWHWK